MAITAGSETTTERKRILVVGAASIVVVFVALLVTVRNQRPYTKWTDIGLLVLFNVVATAIAYGLTVAATRQTASDRAAKFAVPLAFVALVLSVIAFWSGVAMSLGFGAFTIGTWAVREAQSSGWRNAARAAQVIGGVTSVFAFGLYVYFAIHDWAPGMPA